MEARAHTIVGHRYALHERVGQGGCGVVYRATDQTTGDTVAIKMLSRAARQNPSYVERLVREQQALLALAGTHAVAVIDLCRADTGELCLVMEWLQGADLEQHLSTQEQIGTRFTVDELLQVMRPVLETLAKAHELGIVHRDVKPANIFLLSEDRGVRLLDFGFSRLKTSATLTAADTVMGSPSYIAPEAWLEGSKAIGKQADLYAAGVIVFRALAGHVPFDGASLVETMKLVTTAPRPRLSELRPELPRVMDEWLEYALAVLPARRFQDASSFLEALSAALAGLELPGHTLPSDPAHALAPPPAKTTPGERHNALSTALGRAASLLKRVASSFSRASTSATEPTPELASSGPARPELAQPRESPGLAPPPRNPPSRVRTKPALPPLLRPRGNEGAAPPSEVHGSSPPESDLLIAELLPPSMPPPALANAATSTAPALAPEPLDHPSPSPPAPESVLPARAAEQVAAPLDSAPLGEAPAAPPKSKSSKRAAKPRPAKRAAAHPVKPPKTAPLERPPAKSRNTRAKARKPTPKSEVATTKKAASTATKKTASRTKTTPKQVTGPTQATARKTKAAKKQTRASKPPPEAPRPSPSEPRTRAAKSSSKA